MIVDSVVYLYNPYKLKFKKENIDDTNLNSTELLCETLYSVISPGTEVAAYSGAPPLRSSVTYPRLVGYCNVARVLDIGLGVKAYQVGDFVLTFSSHRSHFVITESEVLSTIPKGLKLEYAACAYLYNIGYDAVLKTNISYGMPVVVMGLGVLGLGAVRMATNAGASVYAISDYDTPKKVAYEYGALKVYSRSEFDQLELQLGKRLADVVITTSGSWSDWHMALKLAGTSSEIGVIGFPGRGLPIPEFNPLDSQYFYSKQLSIKAAGLSPEINDSREHLKFNEKSNLEFILSQMLTGAINPESIITDIIPANNLKYAYDDLLERKNSPITFVLKWKK